ncbi:ABC transporter ATP-binding protein [Anaerocolumna sp. MB42-C2]|uniref:ABC transporter ATP-binding protein n=1 Tax=Anaerocolumna sp. MB42-C2 TaxID=3070997 RepID=UPI0027DEFC8F|nr:ABC transporter ATP-binding protein [Anaerocolumna sp. MB42-C2]WMJ89475.1 ABC transporter ATP-binding protein [Anaerocolumna sp. MB42-C2]
MRKLLKYLKDYKKESIIAPLFKMLEATFELFVPLVMASIIDTGIRNNNVPYIFRMGGILLLLGVIGLICSLTAQYYAAKAGVGFGTELRNHMFRHINQLSFAELDSIGTSTLITRITSDINQAQAGVNLVLRLFLRAPYIVAGALIMAFTINVKIALIFLVAVPVLAVIIYGIMLFSIPMYKKVQKKLDLVLKLTRENLVGVRVIKAFCRQRDNMREFDTATDDLMNMQLLVGKVSALLNPVTYVIVNAAIIAIVWYGGIKVDTGTITQGEVIALVNYMTQILLALIALSNLIISFTKAMASASRINEVLGETPSIIETENSRIEKKEENTVCPSAFKVQMKGVHFTYKDAKEESITDLSFSVKAGETIGIIGGTGSGKSTLINLLPRFMDVSAGEILLDGKNVKDYPLKILREKCGVVPQKAVLFKGTIRENIKWGKKDATDEEIYKALEIAQAREFVDSKQEGLETMVLQGGQNLSGGQRQRLTIARALVRKPEILILDDSSSALDFATDAKLRKALAKDTQKTTVFLVSQRATSIRHADKIIVLEDGNMAGYGTHEELLLHCEVYAEICKSQLSGKEVAKDEK